MSNSEDKELFGIQAELVESSKLAGKYQLQFVEENVVFEKSIGKQVAIPQGKNYLGTWFGKKSAFLLLIFFIGIFVLLFVRVVYLQVWKGEYYRSLAEGNRQRIIPVPAERGLVFDVTGKQLTKNIPNFNLTVVPQDLPKYDPERAYVVKRLAELTNQSETEVQNVLSQYGSYQYESVIIHEDIDYDTALLILIESADLPGIQIQRSSKRLYLNYQKIDPEEVVTSTPFSLSHILGYIGKLDPSELSSLHDKGYLSSDLIGKTGLEKVYESILRGVYGRKRIEVDAFGKEQTILAEEAPISGKHLYLTLDQEIQDELEAVLKANLKAVKKQRASAIAVDPKTGGILAMVSLPAFDNNDFSGGIDIDTYHGYLDNPDNPLFNRSIAGTYPSGSTVKPAIAAAGLQEGIISANTSFLSTGGLRVGSWFFPDWSETGHGITNVRKSLAWSVNTFYYYLGGGYGDFTGLGVDKITSYLREFGFSEKTGIDLPGEQKGFLPSKEWKEKTKGERWYVGDTYNLSIGQGDLLATPLQIAMLTATIANGGTLFQPHLVAALVDQSTKEEQNFTPKATRENFINPQHLQTVRLGMKDCVTYGSCQQLLSLPFSSAGKTGTAQWRQGKENHSWFTAFAPFDNPKIVITVLVEEGGGGTSVALPVARQFLQWWGKNKK